MRAGPLRRRVRIEKASTLTDSLGNPVKTWTVLATVQADIRHRTGREIFASQRSDLAETTVSIHIRGGELVPDPGMRCVDVDSGEEFQLVHVLPSPKGERVEMLANSGSKLS